MFRSVLPLGLLLLALGTNSADASGGRPANCVALARTWDEAVAQARLLNVPIVLHDHGFYCGPCWRMHTRVMCDPQYISFARQNTVEVLCLSRLPDGIAARSRRAATYTTQREGRTVECMVEFPGLTQAEVLALRASHAGDYNRTGTVPYTCLVDPYTLGEITAWPGATSAETIMAGAQAAEARLKRQHGQGFSAQLYAQVVQTLDEAWGQAAREDFAAAIRILDECAAQGRSWPAPVLAKVDSTRQAVTREAELRLKRVEATVRADRQRGRTELERLTRHLEGTGLEDRARALLASM